ncbi:Mov34/MPN/PAD-1 family protein [Candidatus Micrarchaeota archaeon]|nr:Mov34/MPN/PAD-1 family protein [Candidatus Micrarchaeota archaeon]
MTIRILKNALESALEAAKRSHPHEFIGLFREKEGLLTELLLAPLAQTDEHSATFPIYSIPTDPSLVATFHSHPSYGSSYPSKQDLQLFSRHYAMHFISSLPHTPQTTSLFDKDGKRMGFEIVDFD